jgi:hypothetical protein
LAVEDLALGLFEIHALPFLPGTLAAAYPLARNDFRNLISMGLQRLVQ